jgi:hypothetical protein
LRLHYQLERVIGSAGDQDAAGFADLLRTRRDVHPITEKIITVDDHQGLRLGATNGFVSVDAAFFV